MKATLMELLKENQKIADTRGEEIRAKEEMENQITELVEKAK